MSQFPFAFYECGTYTNAEGTSLAQNVALTDRPDKFRVTDITDWGLPGSFAQLESFWLHSMAQGSYLQIGQSASSGSGGNYGYVYTLTQSGTVAIGGDVIWNNAIGVANGVSVAGGTGNITVANAGTYAIQFQLAGTEPNQFAITVNGVVQPSAIYASGAGTQQTSGEVLLTLPAGAVLTLRNNLATGAITLAPTVGGTADQAMASVSIVQVASSAGTGLFSAQGSSGGFTFVDQTNPPVYAKVAMTAINGTTGVVSTATTTGISVGDLVRLINVVGAHELSSILYKVTAVSAGVSITLGMLTTAISAGLTIAAGTTGFYQKVYPGFMYPKLSPVLYITQAAQAKVYFGAPNDFTPGELVDFQIPVPYGMTQLSNLTRSPPYPQNGFGNPPGAPRVLVVTNTATESSITINYDTTGFTAFAFPISADYALGASPAVCFPAGSGIVPFNGSATIPLSPPGTNLVDAFDNRAQYVMNIGLNVVGAPSATMFWEAWRADHFNSVTNA